ncbi:MAG: sulfur carrier protein ThiS adenylyltransferase ThiF [Candidatus Eisenbacteria bacterium]
MAASLFDRNVPGMTACLQAAVVGMAGCGGLGSNAAVALARAGVGTLILADHDRVALSDLNRQYFFQEDIGHLKVEALATRLRSIRPDIQLVTHAECLTPENAALLFAPAHLLVEAFDAAESKQWLIETWCRNYPERPIICGSGVAGCGRTNLLAVRSAGNLTVCGDEESDMRLGLCAPRVAIVANMQANAAIEILMSRGACTEP